MEEFFVNLGRCTGSHTLGGDTAQVCRTLFSGRGAAKALHLAGRLVFVQDSLKDEGRANDTGKKIGTLDNAMAEGLGEGAGATARRWRVWWTMEGCGSRLWAALPCLLQLPSASLLVWTS